MSDSVDHPPLPKTAQRLGLRQDCNPERRRPFCNTTAGAELRKERDSMARAALSRACPALGGMFIYSGISLRVSRWCPRLLFHTKWQNRGRT